MIIPNAASRLFIRQYIVSEQVADRACDDSRHCNHFLCRIAPPPQLSSSSTCMSGRNKTFIKCQCVQASHSVSPPELGGMTMCIRAAIRPRASPNPPCWQYEEKSTHCPRTAQVLRGCCRKHASICRTAGPVYRLGQKQLHPGKSDLRPDACGTIGIRAAIQTHAAPCPRTRAADGSRGPGGAQICRRRRPEGSAVC